MIKQITINLDNAACTKNTTRQAMPNKWINTAAHSSCCHVKNKKKKDLFEQVTS